MAIEKLKSVDKAIKFVCDSCDEGFNTGTPEFKEAISTIKENKWWIKKVEDKWFHYCSRDCFLKAHPDAKKSNYKGKNYG